MPCEIDPRQRHRDDRRDDHDPRHVHRSAQFPPHPPEPRQLPTHLLELLVGEAVGLGVVGIYPEVALRSYDAAIGDGTSLATTEIVNGILAASQVGKGVINLSLGGSSRSFLTTKQFMYREPEAWHKLMDKLARVITGYLRKQIRAGAQAVQLFDSWVGCLSPGDYAEYVLPHVQLIFEGLKRENVPTIHFGTGTSALLKLQREAGGTVIGVDWRIHLDEAWAMVGHHVAVQGNLDPVVLFAPLHEIERRVADILKRAGNRPGHIFNLGHGILQHTPVDHVAAAAEFVHKLSQR